MIAVSKLARLAPGHRVRKLAQTLKAMEEAARSRGELDPGYAEAIVAFAASDPSIPERTRLRARSVLEKGDFGPDAICLVKNDLLHAAGIPPADWDFLSPASASLDPTSRTVFPGMRLYLEDVRSPFNIGSIFRSADAFGVAEILVSPFCASPGHPRAERTAMGTVSIIPWGTADLEAEAAKATLFALELGGTPIDEFAFPENGMAVIGSEELGLSPGALALCGTRVSIPMRGAKASVNVGVATGILLERWASSISGRRDARQA